MRLQRSFGPSPAFILTRQGHSASTQKRAGLSNGRKHTPRCFAILVTWLIAASAVLLLAPTAESQQCSMVYSGLEGPVSIVQSNAGDLLVSESGSPTPN